MDLSLFSLKVILLYLSISIKFFLIAIESILVNTYFVFLSFMISQFVIEYFQLMIFRLLGLFICFRVQEVVNLYFIIWFQLH